MPRSYERFINLIHTQTSVNTYKESHHPTKTYRCRPEAIDMLVS